jgi:hypothetical protein
MKKQLTILFFLFICLSAWSQEFIKLTTPCTKEFLQKIPGKWIKENDNIYYLTDKITKQQQQEIFNRLDSIHRWVDKIYSPFFGIDARWTRTASDADFASEYKYENSPDAGFRDIQVNSIRFISYFYSVKFNEFSCANRDPNEYLRYHGEDGVLLRINANILGLFTSRAEGEMAEVMQIDRRPIWTMYPVTGKWKGYDVYSSEVGSGLKIVLLHRKGMLPYIPVTRKQYLDRCITYLTKFFDKMSEDNEKVKKAWGIKIDPSDKEKIEKQKKDAFKHYQDEMEATAKDGLLDSPTIISAEICNISNTPIFTTEAQGGSMLVTENPAYIRKDIPKYIPQFFTIILEKYNYPFPPVPDPYKVIEESFPIEKLQVMIDK